MKRVLSVILAVGLIVTTFAGCGGGGTSGGKDNSGGSTPIMNYQGTPGTDSITVNLTGEPPELCPVRSGDSVSMNIIRHTMENLVMLDGEDKIIPGVAKDWTISEDKLVYTFNLRNDMKWSNGDPVTAHDFVFSWRKILEPDTAAIYSFFGYLLKNGKEYAEGKVKAEELGVKALDDYTLQVTLQRPTAYILSVFAFAVMAPMNEKAYNEFGDSYGKDADKFVTNGAYKVTSWVHESEIVLEKNEDFYLKDEIKIPKIVFKMISDSNTVLNSFKAGELDVIDLTGEQTAAIKAENWPVTSFPRGPTGFVEFNVTKPGVNNVKIRQALTYAIDSTSFTQNVLRNSSKPAYGLVSEAVMGFEKPYREEHPEPLFKAPDIEKAKQLLDEGLKELGMTKEQLSLTMICDDTDAVQKNAAFYQNQWKTNLGIDVQVDVMPNKSRVAKQHAGEFSIIMASWGPDYDDPLTFLEVFETGNGSNYARYSNSDYDTLITKIRAEKDRETRFLYIYQAEQMLMEEMPVGPVYYMYHDYTTSSKVSGVIRTGFQDYNFRFASINQ